MKLGHGADRCHVSLLREGTRRGRTGWIDDSGDHPLLEDGSFRSPPLAEGRYILRFHGLLPRPADEDPSEPPDVRIRRRIFDFLHPAAHSVSDAEVFVVAAGETITGIEVACVPAPWRRVRGRVEGLPTTERVSVMFSRNFGAAEQIGGGGGTFVQPDGSFEDWLQVGEYFVDVQQFTPHEEGGCSGTSEHFVKSRISIGHHDLEDVVFEAPKSKPLPDRATL